MPAYSGLFDGVYGQSYSQLSSAVEVTNQFEPLARTFANRLYGRAAIRELIYALVNGDVGATALSQHFRRKAFQNTSEIMYGGKATIEQFSDINRTVTTADRDKIANTLRLKSSPATYPRDRSGNGGGSKLGY